MRVHTPKLISCTALVMLAAIVAACTSKSGVSLNGAALNPSNSANFTLTSVNGVSYPSGLGAISTAVTGAPSASYAFFSGALTSHAFSFVGNCDHGVAFLQLSGTGVPANTTYTCSISGSANFTYTVSGAVDAHYDLTITPYGGDGTPSGKATSVALYMKNSQPTAPAFAPPPTTDVNGSVVLIGGTNYQINYNGSATSTNLTISGTYSTTTADGTGDFVKKIVETTAGMGNVAFATPAAGQFQDTSAYPEGTSTTYTFAAVDFAGNTSSTFTVSFITQKSMPLASFSGASGPAQTAGSGHIFYGFTNTPILGFQTSGADTLYIGIGHEAAQGPQ